MGTSAQEPHKRTGATQAHRSHTSEQEPHKRTGATQAHRSHTSAQEPHKRTGATQAHRSHKCANKCEIFKRNANNKCLVARHTTYYVLRVPSSASCPPPRRGRTQHQGLPSTRLGCPHPSRLAASMKNKKL